MRYLREEEPSLFYAGEEAAGHKLQKYRPADNNTNNRHNKKDKRKEDLDRSLQGYSLSPMKPLGAGIFG